MYNTIDLFAGIGGIITAFHDSYADSIKESILSDLIAKCFNETPAFSLNSSIHPGQEEYHYARHLADLDILEQFCSVYVRNYRDYKYCRGKADTAQHVLKRLSDCGIYISIDKYNNWRREKGYRLIDNESLELLLELLKITPSEYKHLVYAHISARREIKEEGNSADKMSTAAGCLYSKDFLFSRIRLSRPPCRLAA